jgi:hypothetical protein
VKQAAHRHHLAKKSREAKHGGNDCQAVRLASVNLSIVGIASLRHVGNCLARQGSVKIVSGLVSDEVEGIHEKWLLSESVVGYITFCRIRTWAIRRSGSLLAAL